MQTSRLHQFIAGDIECAVDYCSVGDLLVDAHITSPICRPCEKCGLVEQTVCGDQVIASDCPVVEEEVCEAAQEQECTDFEVQR